MKQLLLAIALLPFGVTACGDSSFSGGNQKGADAVPAAQPAQQQQQSQPAPPTGTDAAPTPPAECTEQGSTQAKLLTESVQNNAANQWIRYELALVNCDGTPRPIKDAPVKFDIDAALLAVGVSLPYVIQDMGGKQIATGSLATVKGSDLFGKSGPQYQYWATDTVTLASQQNKIIIQFDVSNQTFAPSGTLIPTAPTADITLPTYLRYGDASPIEKSVLFKK